MLAKTGDQTALIEFRGARLLGFDDDTVFSLELRDQAQNNPHHHCENNGHLHLI
jgi:hypothetical protein